MARKKSDVYGISKSQDRYLLKHNPLTTPGEIITMHVSRLMAAIGINNDSISKADVIRLAVDIGHEIVEDCDEAWEEAQKKAAAMEARAKRRKKVNGKDDAVTAAPNGGEGGEEAT